MTQVLNYFPGAKVTIFLELTDGYQSRYEPASVPVVEKIIFPSLTLSEGYPMQMSELELGLYMHEFVLPTGAAAVGSYFVECVWVNPFTGLNSYKGFQIVVSAPYGNYSIVSSV